jgi:hypothetical protein
MRGTDYLPVAVHAVIRLLQKLIIAQLVKNFPDFFRQNGSFLDAFAKLPKATIGLVMSVCPSVRMEQLGSH